MTDLIVGEPFGAVQVALRRGLARKGGRQPVIVLDYTGRSNAALDLLDRRLFSGRQLQWFNLGDRRRPFNPYVFRSEHEIAPSVLQYMLSAIAESFGTGQPSAELLRWLVAHWLKLINLGPCDLLGFRASLRSLEATSDFALPEQAEHFLEALDRVIATPVLHSAFQSDCVENPVDSVSAKSLIWLEIPTESLDTHEAQLLGVFGRTLAALCVGRAHAKDLRPRIIQLHPHRDEALFAGMLGPWLLERADHLLASRLDDRGEPVQAAAAWMPGCERVFHVRAATWAQRAARCPTWLPPQPFGILRDVAEPDVWCYHRRTTECLVISGKIHAVPASWSQ